MSRKLIIRRYPFNMLTVPLLLNILERSPLSRELELAVWDKAGEVNAGDIVIFSVMTPYIPVVASEIKRFREGGARVLVGGPHADNENHELLLAMGASAVSAAPAETGLIPLIESCLDDRIDDHPFWEYQGATGKQLSEYLPVTSLLTTMPPVELMRGCGYSCTYCATAGHRRVLRERPSIFEYLDVLHDRHARRVNFIVPSALEFYMAPEGTADSLVFLFEACLERSITMIEYGIFPSEIRPETLDEQLVSILKKYVINRSLTLGLQSGSECRLQRVNRRGNIQHVQAAIELVHASGMGVNIDLIVGFPGEDVDEMKESLDLAISMKKRGAVKIQVHRYFPLGGSADQWAMPSELNLEKVNILQELEKRGLIKGGWRQNDLQWRQYWSWLKENHPTWLDRYT